MWGLLWGLGFWLVGWVLLPCSLVNFPIFRCHGKIISLLRTINIDNPDFLCLLFLNLCLRIPLSPQTQMDSELENEMEPRHLTIEEWFSSGWTMGLVNFEQRALDYEGPGTFSEVLWTLYDTSRGYPGLWGTSLPPALSTRKPSLCLPSVSSWLCQSQETQAHPSHPIQAPLSFYR